MDQITTLIIALGFAAIAYGCYRKREWPGALVCGFIAATLAWPAFPQQIGALLSFTGQTTGPVLSLLVLLAVSVYGFKRIAGSWK